MKRYGTVLRVFDNGGRSFDRYTIIPPRHANEYREEGNCLLFFAIGSSEHPYHPQGFGMTVTAMPGPHLGKRIPWDKLPPDVQKFAREVFPEYAPSCKGNRYE